MSKINLREHYPDFYTTDFIIDVPDELAEQLVQWERDEGAYERQRHRYRANFSLDRDDGIERDILFVPASPETIFERGTTRDLLHLAIASLTEKQAKRIYAHYYLGMSKAAIARAERVGRDCVGESIRCGLTKLENFLKNFDK